MGALRDLVVKGDNMYDRKLLMMFCGVDALEDINSEDEGKGEFVKGANEKRAYKKIMEGKEE